MFHQVGIKLGHDKGKKIIEYLKNKGYKNLLFVDVEPTSYKRGNSLILPYNELAYLNLNIETLQIESYHYARPEETLNPSPRTLEQTMTLNNQIFTEATKASTLYVGYGVYNDLIALSLSQEIFTNKKQIIQYLDIHDLIAKLYDTRGLKKLREYNENIFPIELPYHTALTDVFATYLLFLDLISIDGTDLGYRKRQSRKSTTDILKQCIRIYNHANLLKTKAYQTYKQVVKEKLEHSESLQDYLENEINLGLTFPNKDKQSPSTTKTDKYDKIHAISLILNKVPKSEAFNNHNKLGILFIYVDYLTRNDITDLQVPTLKNFVNKIHDILLEYNAQPTEVYLNFELLLTTFYQYLEENKTVLNVKVANTLEDKKIVLEDTEVTSEAYAIPKEVVSLTNNTIGVLEEQIEEEVTEPMENYSFDKDSNTNQPEIRIIGKDEPELEAYQEPEIPIVPIASSKQIEFLRDLANKNEKLYKKEREQNIKNKAKIESQKQIILTLQQELQFFKDLVMSNKEDTKELNQYIVSSMQTLLLQVLDSKDQSSNKDTNQ